MTNKRVAITGMGAVSPFGRDVAAYWEGLQAAASVIAPITSFDPASLACRIGGEVRDYAPREDLDAGAAAAMDRGSLFAADAAIQAITQAALPIDADTVSEFGVAFGCELAGSGGSVAANVARTVSAAGPVTQLMNGAVGGLMAIGEAAAWIRRGDCALAVCGGAETPLDAASIAHFDALGMLTHNNDAPARAVRPWDAHRDGFALSEGAAALLLEDDTRARQRGAVILGYVEGYASTFNRAPVVQPAANAHDIAACMRRAMRACDVTPSDVGAVLASAGGGRIDAVEAQAITRAWSEDQRAPLVTSIKGTLGHTLGASGAFNAIAALLCVRSGLVPATANLEERDPACGTIEIVTAAGTPHRGNLAMANAVGLGHNASLIISRV